MKHNTAIRFLSTLLLTSILAGNIAATAAAEHEDHLETVLNTIPDIIFYKDLNGIYRGGNQAWAALVGQPLEQIVGKTDFDLFPEAVARSFREYDRQMLESLETSRNDEWVDYPDGRHVLLDTLKTPWLDADGKVLGVLGICRDITHRASDTPDPAREAALLEANDQFYKALDAMFTGDLSVMQSVWSHGDDVSLQGPFGDRIDGWEAVEAHFTKESQMGMTGRVLSKNIRSCLGTDMAYVTCIEEGEDMTIGGKPVVVHHRATNVFRLEDGSWKMVHHHTDLAPALDE
jgi:PAS domain S-box-containing protein